MYLPYSSHTNAPKDILETRNEDQIMQTSIDPIRNSQRSKESFNKNQIKLILHWKDSVWRFIVTLIEN